MDKTPHGLPGPLAPVDGPADPEASSDGPGDRAARARAGLPGADEARHTIVPVAPVAPVALVVPDAPVAPDEPAGQAEPAGADTPALEEDAARAGVRAATFSLPGARVAAAQSGTVPAPLFIVELTDEEIAALDPQPLDERIVVLPWFDTLSEAQQEIATVTAFRSLVVRGLATGPDPTHVQQAVSTGDGLASVDITVNPKISEVLNLRRSARKITIAERTMSARTDTAYLYDVADDLGLVELVLPTGLHSFSAVREGGLAGALVEYLSVAEWAGGEGEDVVVPAVAAATGEADPAAVELLAQAHLQAQFVVRSPENDGKEPSLHAVHAGPKALLVSTIVPGSGDDVRLEHVTRDGLRDWLVERLG